MRLCRRRRHRRCCCWRLNRALLSSAPLRRGRRARTAPCCLPPCALFPHLHSRAGRRTGHWAQRCARCRLEAERDVRTVRLPAAAPCTTHLCGSAGTQPPLSESMRACHPPTHPSAASGAWIRKSLPQPPCPAHSCTRHAGLEAGQQQVNTVVCAGLCSRAGGRAGGAGWLRGKWQQGSGSRCGGTCSCESCLPASRSAPCPPPPPPPPLLPVRLKYVAPQSCSNPASTFAGNLRKGGGA